MYKRFSPVLAAVVVAGSLLSPTVAFAGRCVSFCRDTAAETRVDGIHVVNMREETVGCTTDAECGPSTRSCSGASVEATYDQARSFCTDDLPLLAGGTAAYEWCRWLGASGDSGRRIIAGTHCLVDDVGIASTILLSPNPPPQPAHPGDQFRCRYLCSGDTRPRDGGTCTSGDDVQTCVSECHRACGIAIDGSNCLGVRVYGMNATAKFGGMNQPICIPTQPPSASVGGITDTQRFETVNESFANLSIPAFIGNMIRVLLGIAGALFFAMLVWGGIQWMTAGGDPGQVKSAQSTVRNAVLGVAIIALSYTLITAFMQVIANFAGLGGS